VVASLKHRKHAPSIVIPLDKAEIDISATIQRKLKMIVVIQISNTLDLLLFVDILCVNYRAHHWQFLR
tara:strand:+ start:259 stop:462 length:204 start_codon:yes stop_codon:yes gene_type:complete